MTSSRRRAIATGVILTVALSSAADAQTKRRGKKEEAAPPPAAADKRDRVVSAPGTFFNGRPYWQAAATCGGIYFKLGTVYSDQAARAKVVRPDPAAFASLSKEAERATRAATMFFEAAERFLISDRKLAREEAVITYDAVANASADRVKTIETAVQAAKACPELYDTCRGAFPQTCNDNTVLTN